MNSEILHTPEVSPQAKSLDIPQDAQAKLALIDQKTAENQSLQPTLSLEQKSTQAKAEITAAAADATTKLESAQQIALHNLNALI